MKEITCPKCDSCDYYYQPYCVLCKNTGRVQVDDDFDSSNESISALINKTETYEKDFFIVGIRNYLIMWIIIALIIGSPFLVAHLIAFVFQFFSRS